MTQQSPDTVLERRLQESFAVAHDDARWAADTWADPLGRLRHNKRNRRRRLAVASCAGVVALVAAAVAGGRALRSSSDVVRVAPLSQGPAATGSGLNWLLPLPDYRSYVAAHPQPSAGPQVVPSPAPRDSALTTLEDDVNAVLPPGTRILRDDAAAGGAKGMLEVELRLPDGSPLMVQRQKLDYPVALAAYTGDGTPDPGFADEHFTNPQTWADKTAYSVITGTSWGYSFPASEGGDYWAGPYVYTATAEGWLTAWTAPVSADKLLGWAQASDAHFIGG
jgi:hypothetical protein